MAYNNDSNNSNSNEKTNVNTRGASFKNSTSEKPCALLVTYWNDMVRLEFAPELPENEQTENRKYDYKHTVSTCLTRAKCNELVNGYKNIIVPAIKVCEDKKISVPIAQVNQLQLDINIKDGEPHPVIKLIQNINADNLHAAQDNIIYYEFNRGEFILNYDPEKGTFSERVVTYNELDLFMSDLENAKNAGSNAYIHTDRCVNKYWKDNIDTKLNRIGEANGLSLSFKPQYGNNGKGGNGSIFDNKTGNADASTQSIESMEELDKALGEELPFN